jgi:hypothetical protein
MPQALIQLAYKHIIDATSQTPFEQQVFNATFAEFAIQQQSFSKGQDLFSWSSIREAFPKSNPTLPFKVSFAIAGILGSLNGQIPGLRDTLHIRTIPFIRHRFELLASDVKDPSVHKVSIIYLTDTLTLFNTIGDTLLVTLGDVCGVSAEGPSLKSLPETGYISENPSPANKVDAQEEMKKGPVPTFLLKMQPELSICSYFEPAAP